MPRFSFRMPVLSLLVLLTTAAAAAAQSPGSLKIGIIDTQKIISESRTGQASLSELEAFGKDQQQRLEAQQSEIQALRRRISEGQLTLAEETLEALSNELETKGTNLRRSADDAAREFNRRQQQTLQEVEKKVMPIIQQLGAEQGYSMIFRKFESGLIFASDDMDVTDQVIQRLDAGS